MTNLATEGDDPTKTLPTFQVCSRDGRHSHCCHLFTSTARELRTEWNPGEGTLDRPHGSHLQHLPRELPHHGRLHKGRFWACPLPSQLWSSLHHNSCLLRSPPHLLSSARRL